MCIFAHYFQSVQTRPGSHRKLKRLGWSRFLLAPSWSVCCSDQTWSSDTVQAAATWGRLFGRLVHFVHGVGREVNWQQHVKIWKVFKIRYCIWQIGSYLCAIYLLVSKHGARQMKTNTRTEGSSRVRCLWGGSGGRRGAVAKSRWTVWNWSGWKRLFWMWGHSSSKSESLSALVGTRSSGVNRRLTHDFRGRFPYWCESGQNLLVSFYWPTVAPFWPISAKRRKITDFTHEIPTVINKCQLWRFYQ